MSAEELGRRYRARDLSPVEVLDAVFDRIEVINPRINAFCTLAPETARAAARAAEARFVRGMPLGPLDGVPVSIKDHAATRGLRTTIGSVLRKDWVPDFDAPSVGRLRRAGAVILGKTNLSEFGWKAVTDNPLFGITRNPWHLGRTPGGSSGGAGAAVAAGLGPMATGADAAGSIRIPAALCGIFGLKPTFGLVPRFPQSGTDSLSHDGPMTRTVWDAAAMLDVMAGADEQDRWSIPRPPGSFRDGLERAADAMRGVRIAWSATLGYAPVESEVLGLARAAASVFERLGCVVEEPELRFEDPFPILKPIYVAGLGGALGAVYDGLRDVMDPGLVAVLDEGRSLSAYDLGAALVERNVFYENIRRSTERYDLLIMPAVSTPAFEINRVAPSSVAGHSVNFLGWAPFSFPFNLTGQPAATVPAGFTEESLPVGLQIVGRRFDDGLILRAAAAFEAATPWAGRRPPEAPLSR